MPADQLREHLARVDEARDEAMLSYSIEPYLADLDKRKPAPPSALSLAVDDFLARARAQAQAQAEALPRPQAGQPGAQPDAAPPAAEPSPPTR
ncbi:hypothetical protein GWI72_05415 [Microvirga tunisiensis]|uniref:Uncharacterized protein n=1 Tax=Pannonibacter tanglangensis TaxID=2750084 RepID=A0A7X5F1C6_9HYPH|nr:hypothetical protein [Pannonibacter sp. XCT-53]NBN77704.1 hypothetical protein [Pannonibacter sp. XCT-53]